MGATQSIGLLTGMLLCIGRAKLVGVVLLQVASIKERVNEWVLQIKHTKQLMEDSIPEIMTIS